MIELRDNGPEARALHERSDASTQRSVYLPLLRGITPRSLEAFDPVEQTLVTGRREATTVPAQTLYLLNAPFVRRRSLELSERLLAAGDSDDAARVRTAYRLTLGREPSDGAVARALAFLAEYEASEPDAAPPRSAPAVASQVVPAAATPAPPPANPDEADQTGEPVVEEIIRAGDARRAAWLALAQALFGSAEFRYLR